MDDVLEYARVPVMIQSYTKAQSYAKEMVTPSDKKDNRRDRFRSDAAANSSTSEEVTGLKTNDDGTCYARWKILSPKGIRTWRNLSWEAT